MKAQEPREFAERITKEFEEAERRVENKEDLAYMRSDGTRVLIKKDGRLVVGYHEILRDPKAWLFVICLVLIAGYFALMGYTIFLFFEALK